jgi:N-acetylneuraminic acid mutarotase
VTTWGRVRRWRMPVLLAAVLLAVGSAAVPDTSVAAAGAAGYQRIAPMPIGTTEAQSVVLGGRLYVLGGFDVWKPCCTPTNRAWSYDRSTNTWTALPAMPVHGISHAGIDSDGSRYVYYAGGYAADAAATNQVYGTTDAWRFDTSTGTYTRLPSLPQPMAAGGLAYVAGRLYYFGGANLPRTQDSPAVWMLDVAGGASGWVRRADLPDPRNHLGWAVIGGRIYAVGGQHLNDSTKAQAELDRYDPATDTWTRLAPLPVARSHVMDSTFVVGGRLVVAGGWTTSSVSAAVTAYDPGSNTWQSWSDLPQARTSATAKAFSDGSFAYCCGSAGSSNADGWLIAPQVTPAAAPPAAAPVPALPPSPPSPPPATPVPPAKRGQMKPLLSAVSVHPSTARVSRAGKVTVGFRLNRASRMTAVLRRCGATRCTTTTARFSFDSPGGPSHLSLRAIARRSALPAGHYRLVLTPAGGSSRTLRIVVRR